MQGRRKDTGGGREKEGEKGKWREATMLWVVFKGFQAALVVLVAARWCSSYRSYM
jgi:hypothetical protein